MKMFHFLVSGVRCSSFSLGSPDWRIAKRWMIQLSTCEINGRKIFHSNPTDDDDCVHLTRNCPCSSETTSSNLSKNTLEEFLLHFPHNIIINSKRIWETEQINFNRWFEIFSMFLASENRNRSILALSSTFLICYFLSYIRLFTSRFIAAFDLEFIFTWFSIF